MIDGSLVARALARFTDRTVVPLASDQQALHVGNDDLPFVFAGEGSELQLLHVDLNQNLWVSKTRFQPGIELPRHFHTGCVFAVTLQGMWYYREYPESVNQAGSYLYEPAGSVHTLVVPEQEAVTEVWFAIWGANILMDDAGEATAVVDARSSLEVYRALCAEMQACFDRLIVVGE